VINGLIGELLGQGSDDQGLIHGVVLHGLVKVKNSISLHRPGLIALYDSTPKDIAGLKPGEWTCLARDAHSDRERFAAKKTLAAGHRRWS
jgi:hypothetical protein